MTIAHDKINKMKARYEDSIYLKGVPEAKKKENGKGAKFEEITDWGFLELILKYMYLHISRIEGLQ